MLTRRNHLTAWLGILAMVLVTGAPLASWLVARAHSAGPENAPLCSASQASSAAHGDPLAACGYCDLLADHPAASGAPSASPAFVARAVTRATPVAATRAVAFDRFRFGLSRAPPPISL